MTQKRKQRRHGNAIGEMAALRQEPTHVTKHCPRVVPLQLQYIFSVCKLTLFGLNPIPVYSGSYPTSLGPLF